MLSGATSRASEITGTAVFRIVVSNDSMKNATATSHGKSCLLEEDGGGDEVLMRRVPKLAVRAAIPTYSLTRIALGAHPGTDHTGMGSAGLAGSAVDETES
jgi:hypothetical protein